MNYTRIYNQLIERAIKRGSIEGYTELHHIKPKCLGGEDKLSNLVELTYREHFLAHWLLYRIYPNNSKLAYAFHAMSMDKYGHHKYTPSSRALAEQKEAIINARRGTTHTEETKKKISQSTKGNSPPNKGKPTPQEVKDKQSAVKLGRTLSEKDRQAISFGKKEWFKNNKHPNLGKKLSHTPWDRTKDGIILRTIKVKELYDSGIPISHIPLHINISRAAIYKMIKEYKWTR